MVESRALKRVGSQGFPNGNIIGRGAEGTSGKLTLGTKERENGRTQNREEA